MLNGRAPSAARVIAVARRFRWARGTTIAFAERLTALPLGAGHGDCIRRTSHSASDGRVARRLHSRNVSRRFRWARGTVIAFAERLTALPLGAGHDDRIRARRFRWARDTMIAFAARCRCIAAPCTFTGRLVAPTRPTHRVYAAGSALTRLRGRLHPAACIIQAPTPTDPGERRGTHRSSLTRRPTVRASLTRRTSLRSQASPWVGRLRRHAHHAAADDGFALVAASAFAVAGSGVHNVSNVRRRRYAASVPQHFAASVPRRQHGVAVAPHLRRRGLLPVARGGGASIVGRSTGKSPRPARPGRAAASGAAAWRIRNVVVRPIDRALCIGGRSQPRFRSRPAET